MGVNAALTKLLSAVLLLAPLAAHAGPKIDRWTLDNGVRVYFVQAREIPMLQVRAVFDAAGARDPRDKPGVARLTGIMLREGAAGMSADEIASRFERLGAEFGADSERDMATVDLRSLTDPALLEPALDLFAQIMTSPTFPESGFERERQRMLIGLARDAQSPGTVAQKAFMRLLYGEHPYGADPGGSEASLKSIERADLVAHYERYYTGRNAWLVMIGDLTPTEARRVSRKLLGKLPAGEVPPPLPPIKPPVYSRIDRVTFPATQSHLLVGQPAIARGDDDYYALYIGNYILGGGGLVSRLSNEVREKRGLSYSAYSYFAPMRAPGPFTMGLQTANANRDEALTLMRAVLSDFMKDGPTAQELEAAKKHITGGFPLRLDSNRKIADQIMVIAYYDLPLTYLDEFSARVQAVTAEQIRDAFARHVQPEQMMTVIVGGDG